MLDTTFELISEAASNPHMLFCFCNLIIAILLVGSSKQPTPGEENVITEKSQPGAVAAAGEVSSVGATIMVENEERWGCPHEGDDDDDDDDDLKRRVEEFIEKTNREWRAEKVKTNLFGAAV